MPIIGELLSATKTLENELTFILELLLSIDQTGLGAGGDREKRVRVRPREPRRAVDQAQSN